MMWFEPVSIVDFIVKGLVIGIVASAPMGPVGILCVQRTLNKGRWYGFITGVGAALSDLIYALISGFGMSFVVDFISNPQTKFYMQMVGSVLLFLFGIYTYLTNPTKSIRPTSNKRGTLVHNMVTAFLVTLSNPLIVFLFMALFAQYSFVIPEHHWQQLLGYICIVAGALMWWYGLTYIVDKVRARFTVQRIWMLNRIIGGVVMLVSVAYFLGTILGISSLH